MSTDTSSPETPSRGLSGSLRVLGALCVIALAVLGVLVVLEVIPRSAFTDVGAKIVAVAAIAVVTTLALGLLARR
jgi:hypothetical protein